MYPPSGSQSTEVPAFDLHTVDAWMDNMTPNTKLCPHLQQVYYELRKTPGWIAHLHEIAPLDVRPRTTTTTTAVRRVARAPQMCASLTFTPALAAGQDPVHLQPAAQ